MGQDVHYTFHGQDHTPESISALILRELARAAREQTGEEVHDVVITVPAYFGRAGARGHPEGRARSPG